MSVFFIFNPRPQAKNPVSSLKILQMVSQKGLFLGCSYVKGKKFKNNFQTIFKKQDKNLQNFFFKLNIHKFLDFTAFSPIFNCRVFQLFLLTYILPSFNFRKNLELSFCMGGKSFPCSIFKNFIQCLCNELFFIGGFSKDLLELFRKINSKQQQNNNTKGKKRHFETSITIRKMLLRN